MRYGTRAAGGPAKRKAAAVLASMALVSLLAVGGVVAFIVDETGVVENEFLPSKVEVSISEKVVGATKSDISFSNESDVPAYVRATLSVHWVDSEGSIVAQPEGCSYTEPALAEDSGWFAVGEDYPAYYYGLPLEPKGKTGASTTAMLKPITATTANGCSLKIDVVYEAVQASPASAVEEAWADVNVDANGNLVKA